MDVLSRITQRIFDKEKSHIKMDWLRSPALANNGVLDLTKFNARGGAFGRKNKNIAIQLNNRINELL